MKQKSNGDKKSKKSDMQSFDKPQPSAYCQACIGQKEQKGDSMITCGICQSSIHKSHYGSEIVGKSINKNHLTNNPDDWRCQRCRHLIEKKFSVGVKLSLYLRSSANSVPFPEVISKENSGIMKKIICEYFPEHRKEVWAHPECTTWCFPFIWSKTNKRTNYVKETPNTPTAKFWARIEDEPSKKCVLCADSYGYKIKASPDPIYCPIYCEEHLQGYVLDFGNRVKMYNEKRDYQKVAHFTKLHNSYKTKRAKQEEEIRNQFGKQLMIGAFEESSMSLSFSEARSNEMNSSDSESHSSTFLAFLEPTYELKDLEKLMIKKKEGKDEDQPVNKMKGKSEKKTTKREVKPKVHSEDSASAEMNKIIEEQKEYSMDVEESIEERLMKINENNQAESKQEGRIIEERQVVMEEKYIEGAYQLKQTILIEKREEIYVESQMIAQSQMIDQGQIANENFQNDTQMVEQGSGPKKVERQLSEGEMSEELVLIDPAAVEKKVPQSPEKVEEALRSRLGSGVDKMEEENVRKDSNRSVNPQIFDPQSVSIGKQLASKDPVHNFKQTSTSHKKKPRTIIDEPQSSPSSPESDESYNPKR